MYAFTFISYLIFAYIELGWNQKCDYIACHITRKRSNK